MEEFTLAGRPHLCSDLGWVPVPGDRAGRVLAADRWLGDGPRLEDPAGARRDEHGADAEENGQRNTL